MVKEYNYGQMEKDMKVNGKMIKWMVKDNLHGERVNNIKESM